MPQRVLILTSPNHLYANYLVKELLSRQAGYEVVGIIESTVLLHGRRLLHGLWTYLRTAGPRFFFWQLIKGLCYRLAARAHTLARAGNASSPFYRYDRLAGSLGIPIYQTANVNGPEANRLIRSLNPDLAVLLLHGQILKAHTIALAPKGCINFHPSYLPEFRGLMPIFWALATGAEETGISIHFVNEKIDKGPLVAQKRIRINPKDTEHTLYGRSCAQAVPLLVEAIRRIGNADSGQKQNSESKRAPYYSVPTRAAVREFQASGRKLFTFRNLAIPFEQL